MNPKVSVIVPVYKVEDYVAECVASLRAQSYENWEAILIDDCSGDGSLERARTAAAGDARCIFVERTENGGLSVVRNQGIELASGDYLLFLDSDDYYDPNTLAHLVRAATTHQADLVDFNTRIFYESDDMREKMSEAYYSERKDIVGAMSGPDLFCSYKRNAQYCYEACFHFIARELLERTGLRFLPGVIHEDTHFTPLLHAQARRALYLNEPLYQRRVRADSLFTAKRGVRNIAGFFTTSNALEDWIGEHAEEFEDDFLFEFTQTIWALRTIMANDIRACDTDELYAWLQTLTASDRAKLFLQGTHYASCLDEKYAWGDELQEVYASKTWKLGNALATLPRMAVRVARKGRA